MEAPLDGNGLGFILIVIVVGVYVLGKLVDAANTIDAVIGAHRHPHG